MARGFIFIDKGELNEVLNDVDIKVDDNILDTQIVINELGKYNEKMDDLQIPHIIREAERLNKAHMTDATEDFEISLLDYL